MYYLSKYDHELRFKIMTFFIIIVGLGSFAFHATLLFENQMWDELPMLGGILCWDYIWFEMNSKRGAPYYGYKLPIFLVCIGVLT
eukprot:UN20865